ncbi:MAG: hypothetical protein R3D31_17545 [Hyphomicrobiaceae bacterium]
MSLPTPVAGLVINYSYLWRHEHLRGFDEGSKNRPAAVVLVLVKGLQLHVTVLGITHTPPRDPADAVSLPPSAKKSLGLDDQPSWIVTTEANTFTWPGHDLRPRNPGDLASVALGYLPEEVMIKLRHRVARHAALGQMRVIRRTEG